MASYDEDIRISPYTEESNPAIRLTDHLFGSFVWRWVWTLRRLILTHSHDAIVCWFAEEENDVSCIIRPSHVSQISNHLNIYAYFGVDTYFGLVQIVYLKND